MGLPFEWGEGRWMVGWRREGEGERSGFVILAVRFGNVFPTLLNFSLADWLGWGIICAQEKKVLAFKGRKYIGWKFKSLNGLGPYTIGARRLGKRCHCDSSRCS